MNPISTRARAGCRLALASLALAACARSTTASRTAEPAPMPAAPMPSGPLPLKLAPRATGAAISPADLMTRLYIYADDSMMGREAGTPGNMRATAYIEREVRRLGLEPAGDSGGYFQNLPLRRFSTASALTVDGAPLVIWSDYVPIPSRSETRMLDGAQVVYAGVYGDSVTLTADQLRGRLAVLTVSGSSFRFPRIAPTSPLYEAAGLAFVEDVPPQFLEYFRQPALATEGGGAAGPTPMFITTAAATRLLGAAPAGLKPGAAGKTVRGRITMEGAGNSARNVAAILRGSDPVLRNEYVAIGAHNDHVGMAPAALDHDSLKAFNLVMRPNGVESNPRAPTAEETARLRTVRDSLAALGRNHRDSVFNGADDDGSGTVSVLEIAEALAAMPTKPKRSVLFVWHTGEEKGLWGSLWFTDHPTVPRDSIVTQLNIDMIGRGGAADLAGGGPNYLELIGSRRLSTELGALVESVNRSRPQPFVFDYQYDAEGHPEQIYCRSDHYSYARYGIPVTFFSTGTHSDYHMQTDEPQYIDYVHMSNVAGFVRDMAVTVANLDHRVVVDKPKPDPKAGCRQ